MNAVVRLYDRFTPLAALADQVQPLLLLALRVFIAWVFIKSGLTKINDWDTTLYLFTEEYSVPLLPPAVAAVMGTLGELAPPRARLKHAATVRSWRGRTWGLPCLSDGSSAQDNTP